jgi:tyrosine-protein kinase Etk/Wzc
LEVTREEQTNILNIGVTDTNPVFAQRFANTIALTYKEWHAEQQMKRTTEALKYIAEQLKTMGQKLRESEDEFNKFSQDNQLVSIDMQSEGLLTEAREIKHEIRQLREDKGELVGILARLEQFIENPTDSSPKFYSKKADKEYQGINSIVVGLMIERDTLLEDYTSQHPQVVAKSRRIIENARKMLILLQLQITDMEESQIDLRKELEEIHKKTQVLMDKKLEFNRLKRKVQLQNDMTALLEKKNQEALIKRAEKPEEVTIVKPALMPTKPVNPPKTASTGVMGVIIGIVLGLVIAFIVETFDTSLSVIEDVEETLGTQVLGVIPQADDRDIQQGLEEKYAVGIKEPSEKETIYLMSHFVTKSMIAESFRALRTNIQFKDTEEQLKTIAITSTSPQEGKTLVSINLAITMAQAGKKTLLVGSDLRKPMLDKAFGVETTPGLSDILQGNYPWRDTVKGITDIILGNMTLDEVMMAAGLDNLHIITAGPVPTNPSELIDSSRLTDFMEEAKEAYDVVLFDSTPILSAADAAILGTKVDGVLLVYRIGAVSRGLLKRSTAQLEQINCHIMGVVLNGMRPELSPDFHDFKYYRYYYSYGEEGKKRSEGNKKGFSFSRKKRDDDKRPEQKSSFMKKRKEHQEKWGKYLNVKSFYLLVVVIAALSVGILWWSGKIDLFKTPASRMPIKKDEIKIRQRISKETVQRKAETIFAKPKITASVEKPKADGGSSISESQTEAKAVVAIEKPSSPLQIIPHPYSLYLGSYRTLKRAEKAISIYSKKGLSPYWVQIEFKKIGVWYRVFTGHFEDHAKAEGFRQRHQLKEATVKKTRYASFIGRYSHAGNLQNQTQTLKKLGYSPYVIKDPNGESRLFVGAFLTKAGAEAQCQALESQGIQSELVQR